MIFPFFCSQGSTSWTKGWLEGAAPFRPFFLLIPNQNMLRYSSLLSFSKSWMPATLLPLWSRAGE